MRARRFRGAFALWSRLILAVVLVSLAAILVLKWHQGTVGSLGPNRRMLCGLDAESPRVVDMMYGSIYSFTVSLHEPSLDQVVSKGIRDGVYGPRGTYPSVDEVHAICEASSNQYAIDCGPNRVFVEVGSALGMVSLYAASRGMRVFAFDPLLPKIERLRESQCLNGVWSCFRANVSVAECIQVPSRWGNFSPGRFNSFWNLVGSYSSSDGIVVESEPGNFAATMRGGGSVRAAVRMVTIDQDVDGDIELLLLTCQGFEFDVRSGFYLTPVG